MKRFKLLMLMLLTITFVSACGTGEKTEHDTSLEMIKENKKIVLGLDKSFPPMGFENENLEIVGFDIDLAKEVAERMGVELVLQPISWKAKELELSTKNIDLIWNGMTYTQERATEMTLSETYMKNTQVAVVLADSEVTTLEQLKDKKVIIQNGSTASVAIDSKPEFKNSLKELLLVDNNVQALLDLKTSGSDAVIMDEVVARYYVEKEENTYRILDENLADEDYVIGFRKGEIAFANEVNRILKEMAADGTLEKISNEWFGKDITVIK